MDALATIFALVLGAAARRALVGRSRSRAEPGRGRFTRGDVRRFMTATFRAYGELSPVLPREPALGARMNLALACVTLAFHRALVAEGVERCYATELVGDAAWMVYRLWGAVPRVVAALAARGDPLRKLRVSTDLFRRFPFNPPGYVMRDLESRDAIAFDVLRCPIAEYFRSQDATDVCIGTWCNLDYALAETWGGRLVRNETLAAGAPRCDFRWEPPPGVVTTASGREE